MSLIKCAYADQTLQNIVVPMAFYFTESVPAERLKCELENLVEYFPYLKGRFVRQADALLISADAPQPIAFQTQSLDCSMIDQILRVEKNDNEHLIDPLDNRATLQGQAPLLTIKASYFSCGGMCIGIAMNHAVGDINSAAYFLRAWACAIDRVPYEAPVAVPDREAFILEYARDNGAAPGLRYLGGWDIARLMFYLLVRVRNKSTLKFYFSPQELARMKAEFNRHCDTPVSTNDALVTHLFARFASLEGNIADKTLSLAVNVRRRIRIPQPVIGNLLSPLDLTAGQPFSSWSFAERLRQGLNRFESEHMNFVANHQLVDGKGGTAKLSRFVLRALDPERGNILITNWNQMGLYGTRFGSGELLYFTPVGKVEMPWASAITEGFEGKGLIYNITLPSRCAEAALSPEWLAALHCYRSPGDELPAIVTEADWLY